MDSITGQPKDEASTTLNIKPHHIQYRTHHTLHLKIDSGASVNTLPLRPFQQMYGTSAKALIILRPTTHVKLISYCGNEIQCLGTINIPCQDRNSELIGTTFYVVGVTGPAVVGHPTSEKLRLITVHEDALKKNLTKPTTPISSINQVKSV